MSARPLPTIATSVASIAALASTAMVGGCSVGSSASDSDTVTFGVSATAPAGNMLQLGIAEAEKYFEDEGFTVETIFLGSSGSVLQALASGKIDIGLSTPDLVLQAVDRGQDVQMVYNWTTKNVSRFAVMPDSSIDDVSDLNGATIGVQELSSGPAQMAESALELAGLDPEEDVEFIAVGEGAPALDALQRGRIDAMIAYDTLFAAMTAGTGATLRYFRPEGVDDLFSSSLVASGEWIDDNSDRIVGFGRAWAKASVFALQNPEAGVEMMFDRYPQSKVGDSDEAARELALSQNEIRLESLYGENIPASPQWGTYPEPAIEHWIEFAKDTGLTESAVDADTVYTNEFVDEYNDFDAAKIRSMADDAAAS